jgi:hypothetical protein
LIDCLLFITFEKAPPFFYYHVRDAALVSDGGPTPASCSLCCCRPPPNHTQPAHYKPPPPPPHHIYWERCRPPSEPIGKQYAVCGASSPPTHVGLNPTCVRPTCHARELAHSLATRDTLLLCCYTRQVSKLWEVRQQMKTGCPTSGGEGLTPKTPSESRTAVVYDFADSLDLADQVCGGDVWCAVVVCCGGGGGV